MENGYEFKNGSTITYSHKVNGKSLYELYLERDKENLLTFFSSMVKDGE